MSYIIRTIEAETDGIGHFEFSTPREFNIIRTSGVDFVNNDKYNFKQLAFTQLLLCNIPLETIERDRGIRMKGPVTLGLSYANVKISLTVVEWLEEK